MDQRYFSAGLAVIPLLAATGVSGTNLSDRQEGKNPRKPNVLIFITDDQSYPYASVYGNGMARTPAFDRVAREGVLFHNAFVTSPGSSPSRASILTGRFPWQIEDAGTHGSDFPAEYVTLPDILEGAGYQVGYTGKGWGPGNWKNSGRKRNPAGPVFNGINLQPPFKYISPCDYASNFEQFMQSKPDGKPFCFWLGTHEPHRAYQQNMGLESGRKPEEAIIPAFLPDSPEIRADLLDYATEIEWADSHLMRVLEYLEKIGELDNTLIIATADNGMSFPSAKANCLEAGIHVPLAIRWGDRVKAGRNSFDMVNIPDLMPTILEICGAKAPKAAPAISAHSILHILLSEKNGVIDPSRKEILAGRERHSCSRYDNQGYPCRALRTDRYLYVRNFKPERWPAGDPVRIEPDGSFSAYGVFHDIDASPTLDYLAAHRTAPSVEPYYVRAVEKRPGEELYDIVADPGCMKNLATDPEYADQLSRMRNRLTERLKETEDPRILDPEQAERTYESYKRYGKMRTFPKPE